MPYAVECKPLPHSRAEPGSCDQPGHCRLVKHHYPPGPIHLTRSHLPTLPIYYSVGNFKVEYMEGLKAKGLELFAAYG